MVWVWDMDDNSGVMESFVLANQTVSGPGQWADNFVDDQLIPCTVGDCSRARASAVVSDSWGRIKASFR